MTERILGVFYDVYNELGFGFVESVYSRSMAIALVQGGLEVASEVGIPLSFHSELAGVFRADLVVEDKIILELKTAENISKPHETQLLHYLRASPIEVAHPQLRGSSQVQKNGT